MWFGYVLSPYDHSHQVYGTKGPSCVQYSQAVCEMLGLTPKGEMICKPTFYELETMPLTNEQQDSVLEKIRVLQAGGDY